MTEPKPEESADQQSVANTTGQTQPDEATRRSDAEKRALKSRKRISREEIYDEYGHIAGYSDLGGFNNLQFVFTVEEEVDEDDDIDSAESDEITDTISRRNATTDSTSAESDKSTTSD